MGTWLTYTRARRDKLAAERIEHLQALGVTW
jgi:hypothetical protein